jgi:hypothetical protein
VHDDKLTIHEMAEQVEIYYGSSQAILTKHVACLNKVHSTSADQKHKKDLSVSSALPQYA